MKNAVTAATPEGSCCVTSSSCENLRKVKALPLVEANCSYSGGVYDISNQNSRWAQNPYLPYVYTPMFTHHIRSWLLSTPFTGGHMYDVSNQNPRWAQKPIYTPIFTYHIWSWLLRTPITVLILITMYSHNKSWSWLLCTPIIVLVLNTMYPHNSLGPGVCISPWGDFDIISKNKKGSTAESAWRG